MTSLSQHLRALVDLGYAGEPSLKLIGKESVHDRGSYAA
jgi:hypothetical protein